MNTEALLIMVRNPVAGKVKKRLAATLGPEKALAIYQSLLAHTRGVALQTQAGRYVFYSEFIEAHDEWDERFFSKRMQSGADLGQRMCQALTSLQAQHQKMVLIGSDIPGLSPGLLSDAFAKLEQADVVIGPATDGGYYLIGMRTCEPAIFSDIAWSTAEVLQQTLKRIEQLGKSVALLPPLPDIDVEADWVQHGWDL
ncbi:MAG: hypothetical protein RI973_613 [Bacteroidota bacterium]|jgi:rSAM/selenodomain-associated transferase 1